MCGIFGIITPKPRKLDKRAFCVLGVNNDTRGGDSCGVFIDKKYEYGVNENRYFYNFFPKSKLLNTVTQSQIALGHCRKASIGAINEANAQPVIIKNDNGEVDFVLIHNGTIVNYREMAGKYIPNIDIKNMTDSQVMAHIFYHTGYDVLGEYIGAGAFVTVDYRSGNPEVFFFKGESKNTEYAVVTTVERPLFCTYSNNEFIFSSIMEYLKALRPSREVLTISPNMLLKLEDGELIIIKEYDRKSKYQVKSYPSYSSSTYYGVCSASRSKKTSAYGGYSNFTERYYWEDTVEMDREGIYWIGDKEAHGVHWVDEMGNVYKQKERDTIQVAFWNGVLLKSLNCFAFLIRLSKEKKMSINDLSLLYPNLIHHLSIIPCWKNDRGLWVDSSTATSNYLYSGLVSFPFTTEEASFANGRLSYITDGVPFKDSLYDLKRSMDFKVDSDKIRSQLNEQNS